MLTGTPNPEIKCI